MHAQFGDGMAQAIQPTNLPLKMWATAERKVAFRPLQEVA